MDTSPMNTSFLVCQQPKKQKLYKEQHEQGRVKNIDNLPESVLRYILSFLPTKDAVRTSVLSKKWHYLWTSITNLDFQECGSAKRNLFMNFVERVLLHESSRIKSFSLECQLLHDASRVNAWITSAVRHHVQELYVCLSNIKDSFILPLCLFASKSLTELELHMPCILKLPSSINFWSLKILTLVGVVFFDDHSTQQLFSGPSLEKLSIENCNWEKLNAVSISASKLWSLSIYEEDRSSFSGSEGCQVMIFGSSLKFFNYSGELANEYYLYYSFSVVEADVYVYNHSERSRQVACRVNKLLRGLSNVKDLTLCADAVEGASLASETDGGIFKPVPSCFLSHLKSIKFRQFYSTWEELYVVKIFLDQASVLEKMVISFAESFAKSSNKLKKVSKLLLEFPSKSGSCKLIFT